MRVMCGIVVHWNGRILKEQRILFPQPQKGQDYLIVTPGVRPVWASHGDQKRVMTPKEAIEKGANFIVVGRPITQDPNPLEAAKKVLREIE